MESKVAEPAVASAAGNRPQDTIINSDGKKIAVGTNTQQEGIAALATGTNALTIKGGKKNGAAQQLKTEDALVGAAAGAAASSSSSGFSEEKPSIVKHAKTNSQPGAIKKNTNNVGKDVEPTKEKAKCKGKKADVNVKINEGAPEPPLSPAHPEEQKRSVGGKGMGAATAGMNRESVRARLARKMAQRNLEAAQKEADSPAKNEAENLNLETVSKMTVGDKQELFKKHLTRRVRSIHPALVEKLMSMILVCADYEVVKMINEEEYLVARVQKAVVQLHDTGYYDRAKNDEVFSPPRENPGRKPRKK